MRRIGSIVVLAGLVLPLGIGCVSQGSGRRDVREAEAEAEIWALEQAYWEANRGAHHEAIVATWHDRFLGWPATEPKPIDKADGVHFVHRQYPEPADYTFRIEPMGIRVTGDVAVNHYTVRLSTKLPDGTVQERSMRITHTLLREGGEWKVLGGMSCSL